MHQCAEHLYTCYTHEEINETKVGQLELTKQVCNQSINLKIDLRRKNYFT